MKRATGKGDNYASDMMRVTVELTRKQGGKKINDKKSLIFKFEPLEPGVRRDMVSFPEETCNPSSRDPDLTLFLISM